MSTKTNWVPKVGDKVAYVGNTYSSCKGENAQGTVIEITERDWYYNHPNLYVVAFPHHPSGLYCYLGELQPVTLAPWEVIREAIKLIPPYERTTRYLMARIADRLEKDAKPKPPTLAEATKTFFEWYGTPLAATSSIPEVRQLYEAYQHEVGDK